ncbi:MAG: FAD-dependent oxidoreductase [Gemmatimonadota bacterium]
MERSERSVAVVGAGPAGLAAAWRLLGSGVGVRVYEATSRVGGRLRTEHVSGVAADAAVQLLSSGYTETRRLIGALGQGGRLVEVAGRDALWRGGRPHPVRYGSLTSMVGSGALPMRLKLRMGVRYVPFLERHGRELDLNEPLRAARAGLDGASIAEWGAEHVGRDFVELLVYPLLAAYYGVTPEETGAGFFHALAKAGMHVDLLGVRGGLGELAESMAVGLEREGVELHRGRAVRRVWADASGARVATDRGEWSHDGVVVAVPPGAVAGLLPGLSLPLPATRSSATLVLATRTRLRTGWFGLSIPRAEREGRVLSAVCVQEEKGASLADGPGGSLVLIPAPEVGERWAVSEAEAVLAEALPALEAVLPGARSRVVEGRLVRLEHGVWVPAPGHFERVAALRSDPATGTAPLPPRLALAGDYLVAPTVEGAVRSGLEAADRITAAAS